MGLSLLKSVREYTRIRAGTCGCSAKPTDASSGAGQVTHRSSCVQNVSCCSRSHPRDLAKAPASRRPRGALRWVPPAHALCPSVRSWCAAVPWGLRDVCFHPRLSSSLVGCVNTTGSGASLLYCGPAGCVRLTGTAGCSGAGRARGRGVLCLPLRLAAPNPQE